MRAYHNINVLAAAPTSSNLTTSSNSTKDVNSITNAKNNGEDGATNNILLSPYSLVRPMTNSTLDPDTDSLGFYLNSPRTRRETPLAIMLMHVRILYLLI